MEREENAAEPQNHLYMCTACTVVRMVHVFSVQPHFYMGLWSSSIPQNPRTRLPLPIWTLLVASRL